MFEMAEWLKAMDCKSICYPNTHRFESCSQQDFFFKKFYINKAVIYDLKKRRKSDVQKFFNI